MVRRSAKRVTMVACWSFLMGLVFITAAGGEMATDNQDVTPLEANEVGIAPNAIRVPLGVILLARHKEEYCAIRFTKFWTGKTPDDEYATYESYYQGDKTGNFAGKNVKIMTDGKLSRPRPRGIGRLAFSFGGVFDVKCGPIKLFWTGKGWVCFFRHGQYQGDYGIELAPTKWTKIEEVNVFDPRLEWYKYDERRQRTSFPVERLWQHKERKRD